MAVKGIEIGSQRNGVSVAFGIVLTSLNEMN